MKNLKKIIGSTAVLAMFFAFNVQAQTSTTAPAVKSEKHQMKGEKDLNLSDSQKAQMKANHEKGKAANDNFKETLSPAQKEIVANKSLSREERKEALGKTLSPAQKEMMKNNRMERKGNAKNFKTTLSDDQKAKMKKIGERRKQNSTSKAN